MYTLGIPDRQKRRTLGYLKQKFIDFKENPGMDEDAFRKIVTKLKQQGVTTIGADEELTERKSMKLTDLVEGFSKNLNENDADSIIMALKKILVTWETKQYPDDKTRWEEYFMDIDELVTDFEEERVLDAPSISNLAEQKLRKLIRKTIRQ